VMLEPAITPWALFISSFPAVLGLAVMSWHFVEHPALSRKAWAGDCVGSLLSGVRERLAASFGQAAAPKALK
jgi:peptidoglycan/LPS O-acetylase OafA/YrhL